MAVFELHDKEELFLKEIISLSTDAVLAFTKDRKICYANESAQTLFGYDLEALIGASIDMLLPDDVRAKHEHHMDAFDKSDEISRLMNKRSGIFGRQRDGNLVPLDVSILKHPEGSHVAYSAICRNISESVRMTNSLQLSEKRLSRAQQLAHIGNWEWDISTGAIVWSDEIYRIFGILPQDFTPSYERFLEFVHVDDRERLKTAVNDSIAKRVSYGITHRIVRLDDCERIVHEIGSVIYNSNGVAIRMDGTVQDITESHLRDRALAEAQEKAIIAARSKTEILAVINHELRTPLNGILGPAELLMMEPSAEEVADYAKLINESGQKLLGLVNTILEVSAIESDAVTCERSRFPPKDLIDPVLDIIRGKADVENVRVEADLSNAPEMLYLDRVKCLQMLMHLLTNAIAFSDENSIIKIVLNTSSSGVVLSVEDTGRGMTEDELACCFDLFSQSDMTNSRSHGGLGLGLVIVSRFTSLHGGEVTVKSSLGKGSIFSLILPMVDCETP